MDALIHAAQLAATQHGIVAMHHLESLGIDDKAREHLLAIGALARERYGAYRVVGAPASWKGALLAACWAGGTRALASHRSAAAVRELPGSEPAIQELLCPRWRRGRHEMLIVHESKALDDADMTIVDGIPVTSVERTILDLGAVCSPLIVERAMEDALRSELTSFDALQATMARLGRRGRNGAGVLRAILEEREADQKLTDTDREKMMLQIFRKHGLPDPVPQFVIRHNNRFVARVDAALPELRIAFEYESYQWHTSKKALDRDTARRRTLMALNWWPIGVTSADLRSGGTAMCQQVFQIIRNAAA
jgi:predicted transcriptional regulator of viral defense system